jgi:small-conductance mechanosensitive channel/CRP-like cAMP-binding protein
MKKLAATFDFAGPLSLSGVGIALALALALIAFVSVPRADRRRVRGAIVLLMISAAAAVGHHFTPPPSRPDEWSLERLLGLIALFFMLASMGRSILLVGVRWLRGWSGGEPPRIVQDILQATVFIVVALLTLRAAGVDPGSLLATSALLTAVIGLSLQETLGNMFSGLAMQAERPFEVGDWIQFNDRPDQIGQVVEINWRATKLLTLEQVTMTVPNAVLAKAPISNFSKPAAEVRRGMYIGVSYAAPPQRVIRLLLDVAQTTPGVLAEPPASVIISEFGDSTVVYWVRYFIREFGRRDLITGELRSRVWYALKRAGFEIPFPQRAVHLHEVSADAVESAQRKSVASRQAALDGVDFLAPLPAESRARLAELARTELYGAGETVVNQGDAGGEEFFIVVAGEVAVVLERSRGVAEMARLGPGKFFGEMSLMTGEPRAATVKAVSEAELIVVSREAFEEILLPNRHLLEQVSETLARRLDQLEEHADQHSIHDRMSAEYPQLLLDRIKRFFSM